MRCTTASPTGCSAPQAPGRSAHQPTADTDMAGTNPQRDAILGGPAIILIEPQLGENIGTCARAMLNCGLTDLRLVRPRDGWPSGSAKAAASGADIVLDNARLCDTTEEAIADLSHVFATTARNRGMIKRIMTPREAAVEMRSQSSAGLSTGVLFGPERTGLFNDDLALADTSLTVPLNPSFTSLNRARAVLLIGYECYQTGAVPPGGYLHPGATRPARKEELVNFFD